MRRTRSRRLSRKPPGSTERIRRETVVSILIGFMMVLLFVTCILMIVLILFQDNKAGGLAGAFGGGAPDSPFGARAGERLSRWTLYLGIAFFVLILAMGIANKGRSSIRAIDDAAGVPVGAEPQAPAPVDVPVE